MIATELMSAELLRQAEALECSADETHGADTRVLRTILGMAIGALMNRGGEPATRAYLENVLRLLRRCDDEAVPPLSPPPAS